MNTRPPLTCGNSTPAPARKTGRGKHCRGMTLVEIMIASALAAMVMAGVISMFLHILNGYHYETGKVLINRDIRKLTSAMADNATYANYFILFPSYSERTKEVVVDGEDDPVLVDASVNDGGSGDFLLLVFNDLTETTRVNKLVGYYRSPANKNSPVSEGPVRRFELNFPSGRTGPIWEMLPEVADANKFPEVVELSQGLANGKLFYNFRDRSVMVKGNIIHPGSTTRRAQNTYNFTISPRG